MPHVHSAVAHPIKNLFYIADLGSDKIWNYQYSKELNKVVPLEKQRFYSLDPGSGPRHLCISDDGKYLYCVNELNSIINVFSIENDGDLTLLQKTNNIPIDFKGENYSAEIKIHPSHKFLLASNRGMDTISIYKINQDGTLNHLKYLQTKGIDFII